MNSTRTRIADKYPPGAYHVVSRCVRNAWLCGTDPLTGRDLSHRKQWIEERIATLADSFSMAVCSYAITSNRMHLIVQTDPAAPAKWSRADVLRRWIEASGRRDDSPEDRQQRVDASIGDVALIAQCRERLGSLSCFMRQLHESIARAANAEDACTGHFWESRRRCEALPDGPALAKAMAEMEEARRDYVRGRFAALRGIGTKATEPGAR